MTEYFVQITTAVQVPGGCSYRSFVGILDVDSGQDVDERFWDIVNQADAEVRRHSGAGLDMENGAALILYNVVPTGK